MVFLGSGVVVGGFLLFSFWIGVNVKEVGIGLERVRIRFFCVLWIF